MVPHVVYYSDSQTLIGLSFGESVLRYHRVPRSVMVPPLPLITRNKNCTVKTPWTDSWIVSLDSSTLLWGCLPATSCQYQWTSFSLFSAKQKISMKTHDRTPLDTVNPPNQGHVGTCEAMRLVGTYTQDSWCVITSFWSCSSIYSRTAARTLWNPPRKDNYAFPIYFQPLKENTQRLQ